MAELSPTPAWLQTATAELAAARAAEERRTEQQRVESWNTARVAFVNALLGLRPTMALTVADVQTFYARGAPQDPRYGHHHLEATLDGLTFSPHTLGGTWLNYHAPCPKDCGETVFYPINGLQELARARADHAAGRVPGGSMGGHQCPKPPPRIKDGVLSPAAVSELASLAMTATLPWDSRSHLTALIAALESATEHAKALRGLLYE